MVDIFYEESREEGAAKMGSGKIFVTEGLIGTVLVRVI